MDIASVVAVPLGLVLGVIATVVYYSAVGSSTERERAKKQKEREEKEKERQMKRDEDTKAQLTNLKKEVKEEKTKREKAEKQVKDMQSKLNEMDDKPKMEVEKKQEPSLKATKEAVKKENAIAEKEKEVAKLNGRIKELDQEKKKDAARIKQLEEEKKKAEKDASLIEELSGKVKRLEEEKGKESAKAKQFEESQKKLEDQNKKLEEQCKKLEKEKEIAVKAKANSEQAKPKQPVTSVWAAPKEDSSSELTAKLEQKTKEIDALNERIKKLENENKTAHNQVAQITSKSDASSNKVNELSTKLEGLEKENSKLKQEVTQLKEKVAQASVQQVVVPKQSQEEKPKSNKKEKVNASKQNGLPKESDIEQQDESRESRRVLFYSTLRGSSEQLEAPSEQNTEKESKAVQAPKKEEIKAVQVPKKEEIKAVQVPKKEETKAVQAPKKEVQPTKKQPEPKKEQVKSVPQNEQKIESETSALVHYYLTLAGIPVVEEIPQTKKEQASLVNRQDLDRVKENQFKVLAVASDLQSRIDEAQRKKLASSGSVHVDLSLSSKSCPNHPHLLGVYIGPGGIGLCFNCASASDNNASSTSVMKPGYEKKVIKTVTGTMEWLVKAGSVPQSKQQVSQVPKSNQVPQKAATQPTPKSAQPTPKSAQPSQKAAQPASKSAQPSQKTAQTTTQKPPQSTPQKGQQTQKSAPQQVKSANVIFYEPNNPPLAAFLVQLFGNPSTKFGFQVSDETKLVRADGQSLRTTTSIARYLARLSPSSKLYNENLHDIDAVIEQSSLLKSKNYATSVLKEMEEILKTKKTKFLAGNALTLADLAFWESLQVTGSNLATPNLKQWQSELNKQGEFEKAKNELSKAAPAKSVVSKAPQKVASDSDNNASPSVKETKIAPVVNESKAPAKTTQTSNVSPLIRYNQQVSHFVLRIMADFKLSREESEALWVKFMAPLGKVEYIKSSKSLSAEEIKNLQLKNLDDLKQIKQRLDSWKH